MKVLPAVLLALIATQLNAQNLWTKDKSYPKARRFELARTYESTFHSAVFSSLVNSKQNIAIPNPDGTFEEFQVKEASILGTELQQKFPEIKTYKGVNGKGESIRISVTPKGMNAIFFGRKGTVFLDPIGPNGETVSYYRSEYKAQKKRPVFGEAILNQHQQKIIDIDKPLQSNKPQNRASGSQLKSYRIAIAADHNYTSFHGGTTTDALSAIVTTLNRVTGIYENELAITFVLVDNNDQIIYTSEASDPYNDLSDNALLDGNQTNLDNVIGSDNYDIGHVFKTGSGGLAGLGVVCRAGNKAKGFTGTSSPIGDPFDVDFVAHEIGHQFGGNHTWNGTQGSCSSSNRNSTTAFEPGSGSTIMAYAGICDSDNLQNNSDAYFHTASLDEILTYSESGSGASCAVTTSTGNNPPSVTAPEGGFTIPAGTPFFLTASGSDVDGDTLTYVWEQLDLGEAAAPNVSSTDGPLFRSQTPSSSGTRYFPNLESVVSNASVSGEILPSTSRTLTFQVTVRDNNSTAGGTNTDSLSFNASQDAGPFQVTSLSSNTTMQGGKAMLLNWDVANTDKAPINCSNVSILLSTDGGVNFDQTIVASTPNDGAEFVILPNTSTTQARLMIRAADNIFYDVNAADFTIEETLESAFTFEAINAPYSSCEDQITLELVPRSINGFSGDITVAIENLPATIVTDGFQNTVSIDQSIPIVFTNVGSASASSITIVGSSGELRESVNVDLNFLAAPQSPPTLESPANESVNVDLDPTLSWAVATDAETYDLQVATDDQFQNLILNSSGLISTEQLLSGLTANTTYFWRINASNACGNSEFSGARKFITQNNMISTYTAGSLPQDISSGSTTSSIITVTDTFSISDVNVSNLNISHTFINDLRVLLTSPSGAEVAILDQVCAGEDNILVNLDDEGASSLPCPPTDGDSYQPSNALSSFDGQSSAGNWTLSVSDLVAGDEGTLNAWNLELTLDLDAIWLFSESTAPTTTTLSWTNITSNSGYEIEISSGSGFSNISTTSANINTFTAVDLAPNTSYRFRVRAVQGSSFSNYSNESPVTTLPQLPEAPTNLTVQQLSSSSVLLNWDDNSTLEQGFVIERANDQGTFTEIDRVDANIIDYADETVESASSFSYRVLSFNQTGLSDPSNEVLIEVLNSSLPPSGVTIFPNPTEGLLSFDGIEEFQSLYIVDFQGKKVIEKSELYTPQVDISALAKGVYFITFSNSKSSETFKFCKK